MIQKLIIWSRKTEIDDVAARLSAAFGASGITDPYLTACFVALGEKHLALSLAINRPKAASRLKEKDAVRDQKTHALHQLLSGYACHPDETINTAAQTMLAVFDNFGTAVTRESYTVESSLIGSLLLSFAKPEYKDAIAALSGCAELIARLQTAQDDFEQTRIAYETEKAKEGMLETASEIKKGVAKIINDKIVTYLCAMEQVNPPIYSEFAGTVAVIISENNGAVKKRKKQQPNEATD